MKKILLALCLMVSLILPAAAFAGTSSGVRSYSGASSSHFGSSYGSSYSSSNRSGSTGFQRPSPYVTNPSSSYGGYRGYNSPSSSRSFWGGFGGGLLAGGLLGSMFHPFGGGFGGYGGYGYGFNPFGLIGDLILIGIVFWFIRRIVFRR